MMLVDTYLECSKVAGIGLFAAEDIPAGKRIWRYDPGFDLSLIDETIYAMPEWQQKFFSKYCFRWSGFYFYCIDNARFMNHSSTPNVFEKDDGTYAAVDIRKGEEILCDYSKMGEDEEDLKYNLPECFEN